VRASRVSSGMSASAQEASHRYSAWAARARSGQPKISRSSWAAIQVRASCSSGVSPASSPASSRVQERSEWCSWAAQQPADAVERVVAASAVPGVLALDAAADIVDGGEAEAHHVEGISTRTVCGSAVRSAAA
jgi:hypothetical protein